MKSGLKIIHWIIFLWLLVVIIRYNLVVGYLTLFFNYIGLLVKDPKAATTVLSFTFIDSVLSTLLLLIIIPILFLFKKKWTFLKGKLNFSFAFLIALCFVFLFAP
ncbi:MAG: hypothetical protein OQK64_00275, partial [Ignavibacteriaceae bacterium]|nr:hypothetical protein [Ignavibacteriaceae bacterium]